jgi:Rps23 Pro-64 3,4-dihydroxylase Tpa1-like proline 4-hydroxylase|tara:strand:- start:1105 stop:1653 length:549 start_codon:yes stop_codon:yes gene_type:complete
MTCRSAILIDNFLPQDSFDSLSAQVSSSPEYTSGQFEEPRDELCRQARELVLQRLEEIGLYQPHFQEASQLFGYNQFRPSDYGHGNIYGPHVDNGGYVFYIHPHWDENWGGRLSITNAEEEEYKNIYAKPNRFIWIEPNTLHDVSSTSSDITHSRVTNISFMGGNIHINPIGVEYINILTTT